MTDSGAVSAHGTDDCKPLHLDGSGAGGRYQFATLTGAPGAGAADFGDLSGTRPTPAPPVKSVGFRAGGVVPAGLRSALPWSILPADLTKRTGAPP